MLVNRTVKRNVLVKRVKRFYTRKYKYHPIKILNGNYLLFINQRFNNEEGC